MKKINRSFLQSIYETCKQMGLVETQYQFSELCGRSGSWFSASKTRDLPISTPAAYTLAIRLKEAAHCELPRRMRASANEMSSLLIVMINERARKKYENK